MNRPKRNPGPVPARWLHCPRKAETIIADLFMALKTPLSSDFDDQVPQACRFAPKMMFDYAKLKKIKFGLWIDLTNTTRFYNSSEIEQYGCRYEKLQCRGHGETPSPRQTSDFIQLVEQFKRKYPLERIAVHCTHGFNRTGFLIVSYLVRVMDISLQKAISMFAEARPVGIYKADYLKELFQQYGDTEDLPPTLPSLPDWCNEMDDENGDIQNDGDVDHEGEASTSSNHTGDEHPPKKARLKNATFMEGVPNVSHFQDPKARYLQEKVKNMVGWNGKGFAGSQPVSMDLNNIKFLQDKPYRVSWKADGMRYMMLIDGEDEVYFFDRDNNVFKVAGLRFVQRKDPYKHVENTLLDGEMVIDKVNGQNIPRYLVYDIVEFQGNKIGKMPFYPTRLQCLEIEIIKPRYLAIEKGLINKAQEPFSVRKKDFWEITQAASLLGEKFARSLSHEPDGLIFQPSREPYTAGSCPDVLKWKPLTLNSVDFRLKIRSEGGQGLVTKKIGYLCAGPKDEPIAKMKWTKALKGLDNKIIECKFEDGQWKFMRERTDKSFPNSIKTATAVGESIRNPVTQEYLLDFIERYRYIEMPPPSQLMPPPCKMIRR